MSGGRKKAERPAHPPARCRHCPLCVPSTAKPDMGLCHRYPEAMVVRSLDGHWCGEHPRLSGAGPVSEPLDAPPLKI